MNHTIQTNKQSGFTLIELLIVVAILGLLAAVGIPQYQGYQTQAKINSSKQQGQQAAKLLAAELAKCASGATNFLEGLTGGTIYPCTTSTNAQLQTALVTYLNANSTNAYGNDGDAVATGNQAYNNAGTSAATAASATTAGITYVTTVAGSTGAFTITTNTTAAAAGTVIATVVRE